MKSCFMELSECNHSWVFPIRRPFVFLILMVYNDICAWAELFNSCYVGPQLPVAYEGLPAAGQLTELLTQVLMTLCVKHILTRFVVRMHGSRSCRGMVST
jgi:hypothetical protein